MHKIESRDISNRKSLSKTILACRERQAKKMVLKKHGLLEANNKLGFIIKDATPLMHRSRLTGALFLILTAHNS